MNHNEVENHVNAEEEEESIIEHRLFINHVDLFNGRHLAEYITEQRCKKRASNDQSKADANDEEVEEENALEEEEEEEPNRLKNAIQSGGHKYEIIGTKKYKLVEPSEDILSIINESDDVLHFYDEIMKCGAIIYDITQDSGEIAKALNVLNIIEKEIIKVQMIGPKTYKKHHRTYVFILISNVMTWCKTKPIDRDEPDTPFTEVDYKKRKPHPNYLEQIACEREVIAKGKKYKDKLKTYVICAGLIYGFEEEDFFYLFREAWNNKSLPLFLPGNNLIPTIHIHDLAKVLCGVLENLPTKQYIFAVDPMPSKLKQIVKNLAKHLGCDKIKEISKEDALLYPNITQLIYDRYTINLNMEPTYIVDQLGIEFVSEVSFGENVRKMIAEFRAARNLYPIRVLLHGPPAVGKTHLAKLLNEYYGVHYISAKTMIEETLKDLRGVIDDETERRKVKKSGKSNVVEEEDLEGEGGMEEEEQIDLNEMQKKLRQIEEYLEGSNGRLPNDLLIQLMKTFLNKNVCHNQGYVLDGVPKTLEDAKQLFGLEEGEGGGGEEELGDEEMGDEENNETVTPLPMHVISLDATDEFLCERVMNLPEEEIQGTHFTEEAMLDRLKKYRMNNTEDNTLLNFFDEREIFPFLINAIMAETIMNSVQQKIGLPVGFPPTPDEEEALLLCNQEAERLREEQLKIEQEIFERKALEEYQVKMEEKISLLEDLQMEEEKLLVVQCEPLRNYLMKYVFPTLTQGLLEIARIKPEDPIDYLAEYLFKVNPEGKMFDPTYTRQGELIHQISKTVMKEMID